MDRPIEASLSAQLALESYRRSLDGLSADELRRHALRLAELALVTQPAVIRWLMAQVLDNDERQVPLVNEQHLAWVLELETKPPEDQPEA